VFKQLGKCSAPSIIKLCAAHAGGKND